MNEPLVSVIIPVKDTEKTIEKCIVSLLNVDYQNFEIIVVDDASTDRTKEIIKKFPNIRLLESNGAGPSKARNMAIKESNGEFVAFTDADCIVHPEWLNELLKGFLLPGVAGVGGGQRSPDDETEFGKNVQDFLKSVGFITEYVKTRNNQTLKEIKHNPTCNMMYRREIFEKVGYFLEGLWPGEDVELDYRITKAGYKLMYNPEAVVYHYRPDSIKRFKKMMYSYGWAQGVLVRKYGFFRFIQLEFPVLILISIFIIWLMLKNIFLGLSFLLLLLILPLVYFMYRKQKIVLFYKLFLITIFKWNLGFFNGLIRGGI